MNAIILAAGKGTRLTPLTDNSPKSLVEVAGEPMVERQIRFLQEKGIEDIIVVTGYMAERFEYLKNKYGVKIIHNKYYDTTNNMYSLYLAKDYIGNSYINDADIYMTKNFFRNDLTQSAYFVGYERDFNEEWIVNFDKNQQIEKIYLGSGPDYILSGISFWTEEDSSIIKDILLKNLSAQKQKHWDHIVKDNLNRFNVAAEVLDTYDWFEIDTYQDYEEASTILAGQ